MLEPSGPVALAERALIIHAVLLMLIVVIPVLVLALLIVWHYRASNTKAAYHPSREHSTTEEFIWWLIPFEIVLVLAALTWTSTHELDPHRALAVSGEPLTIQVVALPWKWLFIYPAQGIASVNLVALPINRPVEFDITADAPMNSFWIPQLGGQIYAMTGMVTTLHLDASEAGSFPGSSANYSGEGFAEMRFIANAMSQADFDAWVAEVKKSAALLDGPTYARLAKPSVARSTSYYGSVAPDLFDSIVMQFMGAPSDMASIPGMQR